MRVLRDRSMAEDFVQVIFLLIWEHPERFDPRRGLLRTYLLTLTRGRAIDVVRSKVRRVQREDHGCRSMPTADDRLDRYTPQNVCGLRPALEQLPRTSTHTSSG